MEVSTPSRIAKSRVLIVDDDEVAVDMFRTWLENAGYAVRTACDPEAAFALVARADALIVDARMPNMDGLTFLRLARATRPDIPAVIITGDYLMDDAIVNECRLLKAAVIFKPVWLDHLTAATAQLLEQDNAS